MDLLRNHHWKKSKNISKIRLRTFQEYPALAT